MLYGNVYNNQMLWWCFNSFILIVLINNIWRCWKFCVLDFWIVFGWLITINLIWVNIYCIVNELCILLTSTNPKVELILICQTTKASHPHPYKLISRHTRPGRQSSIPSYTPDDDAFTVIGSPANTHSALASYSTLRRCYVTWLVIQSHSQHTQHW